MGQTDINAFLGTLLQQQPPQRKKNRATSKTTEETRRESHEKTNKQALAVEVIKALKGKQLTAREIAVEMYNAGLLPYPARAVVQPRITELVQDGKVEAVGKKMDEETQRIVAIYRVVEK